MIWICVSGCRGIISSKNKLFLSGRNIRARIVSNFGQVVFSSVSIVWIFLWNGGGHKKCAATSLNYEYVGLDIVTTASTDGGKSTGYFTYIVSKF